MPCPFDGLSEQETMALTVRIQVEDRLRELRATRGES